MYVNVVRAGKKPKDYGQIQVDANATVMDVKIAFEKAKGMSRHRQGLKYEGPQDTLVPLTDDDKKLSDYGVKDGGKIQLKDFGPQIGYRTVFVLEYLGPLLFVWLYALRPSFIYGPNASSKPWDPTAVSGVLCWSIHFLKREFETFFVHRFSRPTMPLQNLFKNCTYYWSFGAVIGYPLCHPAYQAPVSSLQVQTGLALFAISEFLNFCVHVQLRNMRPKGEGSKERPVPKGPLFALVSCPNYTFEVLGWVGFSIFSQIFFSYVFTVIGFLQMADWAIKKHRNYVKSYGDAYKKLRRKAIVPFVL